MILCQSIWSPLRVPSLELEATLAAPVEAKQTHKIKLTRRLLMSSFSKKEQPMRRLNLTSWQRRGLRRQLVEIRDARLYRKTLSILEFDQGRSAADIARMLGVTRETVYAWIRIYTQDHDPHRAGGPARPGALPVARGRPRALVGGPPGRVTLGSRLPAHDL